MSSIPTKQIDGDVAVGRNVTIGGKATVRGSATIGHNLKVEGWLDAPNIKGAGKGLFLSVDTLKENYPRPGAGWWALVADQGNAILFVADDGVWVETEQVFENIVVDSEPFEQRVSALNTELQDLAYRVAEVEQNDAAIDEALARLTPRRVSEEQMEAMIAAGEAQPGQLYYAEED